MPSFEEMILPKTEDEKEFERMCKDVLYEEYGCEFRIYGRKGQNQNGIDLIDLPLTESEHIVVQCKNYCKTGSRQLIKQLDKDIKSTKNLEFKIKKFIVMTALDTDKNVQDYISKLKKDRDINFDVDIRFWDDIQIVIKRKSNLRKKYYPNLFFEDNNSVPIECKNELREDADNIKGFVEWLVVLYNENNISRTYNRCVVIYTSVVHLVNLSQKYYYQLKESGIIDCIEKLAENIPEFFEATDDDLVGVKMLMTINRFLDYFSEKNNQEMFISCCDEIIKKTDKL